MEKSVGGSGRRIERSAVPGGDRGPGDASIAAIVVTYDSADEIGACLTSLEGSSVPVDVVVVDNGSHDDTVARVRREHPAVAVVEQDNLGYAGGNNRGLAHIGGARYRYAFLVNPDVVLDARCAERLAASLDANPRAAIACPKMYNADGRTIWFAGATIDWGNGLSQHRGQGQQDTGLYDSVECMERACGAAMLVRLAAAAEVGPMREEYFLYLEEVDWSRRFVEAGHELLYVPTATCRHDASSSIGIDSARAWYYATRNSLIFMSWHGHAHLSGFRAALRRRSWGAVRRWLVRPTPGNLARTAAVCKAYVDFARGRYGKGW